jgi:hypothetical protein
MKRIKHQNKPETSASSDANQDLLWGVPAIARALGRTPSQTYHLIAVGALDGAVRKLSHKVIVGSRDALRRLPLLRP